MVQDGLSYMIQEVHIRLQVFLVSDLAGVIFFLRKDQNLFTAIEITIVGNCTAMLKWFFIAEKT